MKATAENIDNELKKADYKFLGWQNGWATIMLDWNRNVVEDPKLFRIVGYSKEHHPEYNACIEANHKRDNIQHSPRGSENTVSCDICKIYYKYDCSD